MSTGAYQLLRSPCVLPSVATQIQAPAKLTARPATALLKIVVRTGPSTRGWSDDRASKTPFNGRFGLIDINKARSSAGFRDNWTWQHRACAAVKFKSLRVPRGTPGKWPGQTRRNISADCTSVSSRSRPRSRRLCSTVKTISQSRAAATRLNRSAPGRANRRGWNSRAAAGAKASAPSVRACA